MIPVRPTFRHLRKRQAAGACHHATSSSSHTHSTAFAWKVPAPPDASISLTVKWEQPECAHSGCYEGPRNECRHHHRYTVGSCQVTATSCGWPMCWVTETSGSVQRSALLRPLVAGRASCRRQEGAAPPLTTGGQPHPARSIVEGTGVTQQRTPKMGPLPDLSMTGTGAGDADGSREATAKGKVTGHEGRPRVTWLPLPIARNMLVPGPGRW